jgi:hypothetical protein
MRWIFAVLLASISTPTFQPPPPVVELVNDAAKGVPVTMLAYEYGNSYHDCQNVLIPYLGLNPSGQTLQPNTSVTLSRNPKSPRRCFPAVFSLGPNPYWADQCIFEVAHNNVRIERRYPSNMRCRIKQDGSAWLMLASYGKQR